MDGDGKREGPPTRAGAGRPELHRVRAVTRSAVWAGGLPVLVGVGLVVVLCVGLIASGALRSSAGKSGSDGFQPTGLVGCFGGAPGFSPDVVPAGGVGAESEPGAQAAALKAFVAANPDMPATGYRIVLQSGSTVMYLAPAAGGGYVEVRLEPGNPDGGSYGADGWRTSGYGGCPLMALPPAGYGAASWALDPATPYTPGATELHVLVDEWGCHGSQTAEGRIAQNVEYQSDAVVVSLVVLARLGAQTCPGTPPTPYVVHLTEPVGTRNLSGGGNWPPTLVAAAGRPFFTPTPTPPPANWHMPMDCTGEAEGAGSFKAASMSAKFDVYCAVMPAGWQRTAMSDFAQTVTSLTVTYAGPNGAKFELSEGDLCTERATVCAPGKLLGTAMFGDREGRLVSSPPGADFALYVAPAESPSWKATGSGMTLEQFEAFSAALIVVAK